MKFLIALTFILVSTQSLASSYSPNKWAKDSVVADAQANPSRYKFDDGGNIDFGNSIYKRRISLSGKAQACYSGNYLYAGTGTKCVKKDDDGDCVSYGTFDLVTVMTGKKEVCKEDDDGKEKCWSIKINNGPDVKVALVRKQTGTFKGFTIMTLPACDQ